LPMKQLYLHVGAPKTGTTSIQNALDQRRQELKQLGILYPTSAASHCAQHRIAFGLRRQVDPATGDVPDAVLEIEAVRAEFGQSGAHTVILSSEGLFSLPKESIDLIHKRFEDLDTKVVAYIRRQDEMLISTFNQRIKSPEIPFRSSFAELMQASKKLPDLNYKNQLHKWSLIFGRKNVVVRCYELAEDVVEDFRKTVEIPIRLTTAGRPARLNARLGTEAVHFMRLTKFLVADPGMKKKLFGWSRKWLNWNLGPAMNEDERRQVLALFKDDNGFVFERYLRMQNLYDPDMVLNRLPAAQD